MLYWLLNLPHTNTKINDVYVPGFIVAVLGFGCQGPLQSRMCLRDQDPLKAWDFKPLVWTPLGRHSTRLPVVRCWKRALSLLWPLTTSQTPMRDLSGLHCCKSFSCCFCSIFFAVINHSGAYYVLLNPESPSGGSPNETCHVSLFLYTLTLQTLASLAFSRKNLFTTKALKALSKLY